MLKFNNIRTFSTSSVRKIEPSKILLNDKLSHQNILDDNNSNLEKNSLINNKVKHRKSRQSININQNQNQNLDLSLLENAYKKYEQIAFNSVESTYLTSKISPLRNSQQLKNYMVLNKNNFENFKNFNYLPINFGLNQNIKLKDPQTGLKLMNIMKDFKNVPIKYCFAYGSSVFKQENNVGGALKQTDLIMATTFPDHFHSLNLNKNPNHYSFLKKFGSNFITKIQEFGPVGIYFNPYVKTTDGENLIKYGVVSMERCINDLLNWDSMYIAGRLQKPVKLVKDDSRMRFITQENLRNAVGISLLLLQSNNSPNTTFDLKQLFEIISSLSYKGDIRTKIGGENPKKIQNIVNAQFDEFKELYSPILEIFHNDEFINLNEDQTFKINDSPIYKSFIIENSPTNFQSKFYKNYLIKNPNISSSLTPKIQSILQDQNAGRSDIFKNHTTSTPFNQQHINVDMSIYDHPIPFKPNPFILNIAEQGNLNYLINKSLEQIIMYPSIVQSLKGIATAGIGKSWNYAREKRKKFKGN